MKTSSRFLSGLTGKFKFSVITAALLITIFSGCQTNQSTSPEEDSAWLEKGGVTFTAELLGANEVVSGDPDGYGTARITIKQNRNIEYEITVNGITLPAIGAHIHAAPAGTNGTVVVAFVPPDETGYSSGLVENVDKELLRSIKKNPSDYYINVHNPIYPAGALRGQLER